MRPVEGTTRLIRAPRVIEPCSQTSRAPSAATVIPFAATVSAGTTETSAADRGKQVPSSWSRLMCTRPRRGRDVKYSASSAGA